MANAGQANRRGLRQRPQLAPGPWHLASGIAPNVRTLSSTIEYKIRRSNRATHARVVVDADGVEVVVPRRMSLRQVPPLVEEKRRWIERTLRQMREAESVVPPPQLTDGGWVPYLGRRLELRVRVEPRRVRDHVKRRGDELHVAVGDPDTLRQALERWYRREARREVEWRLRAATRRAGTRHSGLTIRAQRTRWASCSSTGAMSFNWRLLLAPEEILDYVIEHEVAHLEVLDHSPRFWRLLGSRCPGYKRHERWLRRHGPALRL